MQGLELLKTYDKAGEVVKKFYLDKLADSLNDKNVPDNYKEFINSNDYEDEQFATLIDAQPRALFDLFDEYGIVIVIDYDSAYKNFIFHSNNGSLDREFKTRREAEKAAIEESFKLLNYKL